MQVVTAGERQDGARRQREPVVACPGAAHDGRFAAGELDDAAAIDPEERGDAPRGQDEDLGGAMPEATAVASSPHHGVLLGDAREQHAPDDHDEGQRAEDEDRADRVRSDARARAWAS